MALNINEIVLDALGTFKIPRGTTAERTAITGTAGDLFWDTTLGRLYIWAGSPGAWQLAGAIDHGELGGLSDDDHAQYLLVGGGRAMSGDLQMGGNQITGLGTPSAATDAATKEYVDDGKVWKDEVLEILNTPPAIVAGNRYIVGDTPTGAWVGHENDIAEGNAAGDAWEYETPAAGWTVFNIDDSQFYVFTGLTWNNWNANVNHSSLLNLHTGPTTPDDHPQYLLKNTADLKAGTVAAGSFAGTPRKYAVVFGTAIGSANYSVVITGADMRTWTIETKTAAGFTINANSGSALTGNTHWVAIIDGEHHQAA